MKRSVFFILFAVLLSYPAISGASEDPMDSGRASSFTYPIFSLPMGGDNRRSSTARDRKEEQAALENEQKAKETRDKKVDDAIKKAWEEK